LAEDVAALLENPTAAGFKRFAASYRAVIKERFERDRRPFDELAELAMGEDVFIGCNCPTHWNPDVKHCHTTHALAFMHAKYPKLRVRMP
jgi:hypothetical protein